jgi:tetratricopeptide (TPR) repeat protein
MSEPNAVLIRAEDAVIPTYLAGRPNRNPMFLEKRVYQGSSGRVYPYPVIDKILDEQVDERHRVVFLENRYLKLMVMPGFGGRIQYAYDKTNGYPFIYHNKVIKPALVGLAGPWLSGGIEFNWPQHHRPGTYCPVDYTITENADGSATLWLSELEPMWHLKGTLGMTLYPDRAILEISIRLFNPTQLPQSFHLWTNPAVHVNDRYQSVFPPDVQAVYDHGKRDVSSFPIARGEYYKVDYSRGVDISWYKNLPVPTSYMAAKSNYDFLGGYDHGKGAGVLHVADHHVIPGKKQWVWGCGDFGKAWDRNLTDRDGPYAELMCGVFADNQPDFSWLQPFEEKEVKQFFLPYKATGYVRNATTEAAVSLEISGRTALVGAYATKSRPGALVRLMRRRKTAWSQRVDLGPELPFKAEVRLSNPARAQDWELSIISAEGQSLVAYRPEPVQTQAIPEPAAAIPDPGKVSSVEALWLAGRHLEQYRHATREPEHYYREALRRDPNDLRNNNALGLLLLRRGRFDRAEPFFRAAIKTQTRHNSNPPDGEPYYNLGVCLRYLGRLDAAYDAFYKAAWNAAWQDSAFFNLAQICAQRGDFSKALEFVSSSLTRNANNQKATHLKLVLLRKLERREEARLLSTAALARDPLDFGARNESVLLGSQRELDKLRELMGRNAQSYLAIAADYAYAGAYQEAIDLLERFLELTDQAESPRAMGHVGDVGMPNARPMAFYFLGYYATLQGDLKQSEIYFARARAETPDRCFPNSLDSILALQTALAVNPKDGHAGFYLGNLWYDKRQIAEAKACWEQARRFAPSLPTLHRNLALVYFNKENNSAKALKAMARAFALDETDARVLFELDLLKKRARVAPEKRLAFLRKYRQVVDEREDLLIEFVTLLNSFGQCQEAFQILMGRKFHPWEGGEGKVTGQYVVSLIGIARELLGLRQPLYVVGNSISRRSGSKLPGVYADETLLNPENQTQTTRLAIKQLERARIYPENLGEGKLHGAQENQVLYWLGVAHAEAGGPSLAAKFWQEASTGMKTPTPAVYYNDQNPETIFYQGLALQQLGKPAAAAKRFETLIRFCREHLNDEIEIDYFAVSLPEFMVFDDDLNQRNEINCRYLLGLGLMGRSKWAEAKAEFKKVLRLEPAHQGARLHLSMRSYLENTVSKNRRTIIGGVKTPVSGPVHERAEGMRSVLRRPGRIEARSTHASL